MIRLLLGSRLLDLILWHRVQDVSESIIILLSHFCKSEEMIIRPWNTKDVENSLIFLKDRTSLDFTMNYGKLYDCDTQLWHTIFMLRIIHLDNLRFLIFHESWGELLRATAFVCLMQHRLGIKHFWLVVILPWEYEMGTRSLISVMGLSIQVKMVIGQYR